MQKSRSYAKHFLIIGGGSILNIFVGLITTPIITRLVGVEEYGQYSIFTMYASIALMVLCMGLDQSLIRFFYRDDSVDYQKKILFECWRLPVIVSVLIGIVLNLLCYTGVIQMEFDNFVVTMLCLSVVLQIINRLDLILLRVTYQSTFYTLLQVLFKSGFAILAVIGCKLVKGNYFHILVVATVISYAVVCVLGIMRQHTLWEFWSIKTQYQIDQKELYLYAFPFIISMGITTLFQAMDKMSLNYYCTYSEVGIYSSAMTLVHVFVVLQSTFNAMWAPMSAEHYEKDPEDREFYVNGNRMISFIMYFAGFSLVLMKDIFALLLGSAYREAAFILPFLIFNPIMMTVSESTVMGLMFKKKSYMQIVIGSIGCLTNLVGNMVLVPRYAARGAAISTGISYIVFFIARTVISNRYYYVNWKLGRFWIVTAIALCYVTYNTFHRIDAYSVIGYVLCVTLLFWLYRDVLGDVISMAKAMLQKIQKKK